MSIGFRVRCGAGSALTGAPWQGCASLATPQWRDKSSSSWFWAPFHWGLRTKFCQTCQSRTRMKHRTWPGWPKVGHQVFPRRWGSTGYAQGATKCFKVSPPSCHDADKRAQWWCLCKMWTRGLQDARISSNAKTGLAKWKPAWWALLTTLVRGPIQCGD